MTQRGSTTTWQVENGIVDPGNPHLPSSIALPTTSNTPCYLSPLDFSMTLNFDTDTECIYIYQ